MQARREERCEQVTFEWCETIRDAGERYREHGDVNAVADDLQLKPDEVREAVTVYRLRFEEPPGTAAGIADYAVVSLHSLRIYLEDSYREALHLLSEMSQILRGIGCVKADFSDHSTLVKAFDRIKMTVWRVLLRLSAQLHKPSGHAAMDPTFFDRENARKHYCRRTNYRMQTL